MTKEVAEGMEYVRREQEVSDSQNNDLPHASVIFQWLPMPVDPSPSPSPSHSSLLTHISPYHRGTAVEEARLFG